jgi:hypothetical protein
MLVLAIIVLSLVASAMGVFSAGDSGQADFTSVRGEYVNLYGKGIYQRDSVAVASQGVAQDWVTLVLGLPLLVASLLWARRGSLRGRLLLTGTLAYFLYTYASYTFLAMFNQLFLVYVLDMCASLYAFVLCMASFDVEDLAKHVSPQLPVGFVGGFLIFISAAIGLMWLGRIAPGMSGGVPAGLEHYSTLVIQGLDLGFVVPTAILGGVLLIRRRPFGYLLASVMVVKGITMLTALTAMIIGQLLAGVSMGIVEIAMFPLFNLVGIFAFYLILKNVKEREPRANREVA